MTDIANRLGAADDLDRLFDAVKRARGDEPRQPADMVEMRMRQQDMTQPAKAEPGAHQLALSSLAAIDQKPIGPASDIQCRRAALGRGHSRGSSEKDEIKHGCSIAGG